MDRIRAHPYISALGGAIALIIVGGLFVGSRAPASPNTAPVAWEGTDAPVLSSGTLPSAAPPSSPTSSLNPANEGAMTIAQQVANSAPYTYTPSGAPQSTPSNSSGAVNEPFNFDSFVSELENESAGSGASVSAQQNSSESEAYTFIPSGIISTTSPAQASLTPTQQALYEYGNELGSYIQSFEEENSNEGVVLTNEAQDRTDPDKVAALAQLGNSLSGLGKQISEIEDTPTQAQKDQDALASSYQQIGKNLVAVSQAQGDSAFISAVETYDASADTFTKNYVGMAVLFGAYGVTFGPDEPGSEFTFTPTSL